MVLAGAEISRVGDEPRAVAGADMLAMSADNKCATFSPPAEASGRKLTVRCCWYSPAALCCLSTHAALCCLTTEDAPTVDALPGRCVVVATVGVGLTLETPKVMLLPVDNGRATGEAAGGDAAPDKDAAVLEVTIRGSSKDAGLGHGAADATAAGTMLGMLVWRITLTISDDARLQRCSAAARQPATVRASSQQL
mmetsp:Transcript_94487/g.173004  ORF Transcript_94487/g.173004 Transcript_94487/m.173004 type:complete len:195 (+) Transcript_94487:1096-1680(+)